MTVEELRRALEEFPDHHSVWIDAGSGGPLLAVVPDDACAIRLVGEDEISPEWFL